MTVEQTYPLMDAVRDHLEQALASAGVPENDEDAAPSVPVFTEVTEESNLLYVRLEGFTMHQGNSNVGHTDRHNFRVHVFHDKAAGGDRITRGPQQCSRIEGIIQEALKNFQPLPNATELKFLSSFEAEDPSPDVTSRVSRYQTFLTGA